MNGGGYDPDWAAVLDGIRADGDLILNDVIAAAEADRHIRRHEARQARRRTVRRWLRGLGIAAVVAAVAVLVWLFADAIF